MSDIAIFFFTFKHPSSHEANNTKIFKINKHCSRFVRQCVIHPVYQVRGLKDGGCHGKKDHSVEQTRTIFHILGKKRKYENSLNKKWKRARKTFEMLF